VGPPGQGRSFAPGFDPANYFAVFGQFPTQNVFFDPDLRSPTVREFSASYGVNLAKGYVEGIYVSRRTVNLVDDFVEASNGFTDIAVDGEPLGTFTNIVWKNTDLARREYDALVLQTRYRPRSWWTISGHYTLQLQNDGNYEGGLRLRPSVRKAGRVQSVQHADVDEIQHEPSFPTTAALPTRWDCRQDSSGSPRFGQADSPRDYASPFTGATGGRAIRAAVGVRF